MSFWIKTHPLVKLLFPKYIWDIPSPDKSVYLTFDDGPIPAITEFVLEQLKAYDAKATFFCIGENAVKNPQLLQKILANGHKIGNHTYNHLNGWKTSKADYIQNMVKCDAALHEISGKKPQLFRPPYGKIKLSQSAKIRKLGYRIIMWDVISFDFDQSVSPEKCLQNILQNISEGSIVVFHDSIKAFKNLEFALPKTLQYLKENGYKCEVIS